MTTNNLFRTAERFARVTRAAAVFIAASLLLPLTVAAAKPCIENTTVAIPDIAFETVTEGLIKPVDMTHAGDGSGRLFVVEQAGRIRIIDRTGQLLPEPFLDIRERVSSGGEKGLLGLAFHPRYRDNGLFYVNYTRVKNTGRDRGLETVISRFRLATQVSGINNADPGSETVILTVKQPYANHNGGQLAFGPDGLLYAGLGDGGAAYDPHDNGQNRDTLLGSLIRIDVDHPAPPLAYALPADNPFAGPGAGKLAGRGEIWAYGLRNPWRFSFDAGSGRLYLADVGQDRIEEINIITRGGNYGWGLLEGNRCVGKDSAACAAPGFIAPIFTYPHPEGFSVTGGYVYRGDRIEGLCGVYLYADYVSQRLSGLRFDGQRVTGQRLLADSGLSISSFGQDESLALYVLGHLSRKLVRIIPIEEKQLPTKQPRGESGGGLP